MFLGFFSIAINTFLRMGVNWFQVKVTPKEQDLKRDVAIWAMACPHPAPWWMLLGFTYPTLSPLHRTSSIRWSGHVPLVVISKATICSTRLHLSHLRTTEEDHHPTLLPSQPPPGKAWIGRAVPMHPTVPINAAGWTGWWHRAACRLHCSAQCDAAGVKQAGRLIWSNCSDIDWLLQ